MAALFALLLVLALNQGVANAAYGVCSPSPRSVIAHSGDTNIYRVATRSDDRVFVCSTRFRGRTLVGGYDEMDTFAKLTTSGSFAAFTHTYFNYGDTADTLEVEVVNLRLHRYSLGAEVTDSTPKKLRVCDYPETSEFCYFSGIRRLLVTRSGSVAFGASLVDDTPECPEDQVECPDTPRYNVIYRLEFNPSLRKVNRRALDHVRSKELSSLRLAGSRMRWTGHGDKRSASIR